MDEHWAIRREQLRVWVTLQVPVVPRFQREAERWDAIYSGKGPVTSRIWNRICRKNVRHRLERTFELLGDLEGKDVLDLGCGSGRYLVRAVSEGARRAVGIDSAPAMVALADRLAADKGVKGRVQLRLEDFRDTMLDETFDVVLVIGVLDYTPDAVEVLRAAAAWSRETVVATFPNAFALRAPVRLVWWRLHGLRTFYYPRRRVLRLTRQAGLRPSLLHRVGPIFLVVAHQPVAP